MGAKRSVAVRILGHEYRIRTDGDEAEIARVAALVDQTMDRIRRRTGTVDTLDLAILGALNLANELLSLRAAARDGVPSERLRALVEGVEAVLGDGTPRAR